MAAESATRMAATAAHVRRRRAGGAVSFEHRHYPEGPSGASLSDAGAARDREERLYDDLVKARHPSSQCPCEGCARGLAERVVRDCYDGLPHCFADATPGGLCDDCQHETSAGAVACADCGRCECAPCHERLNHRS